MEEFIKIFGQEGVTISCSCWYFESWIYEFTFHVKRIEQINTQKFSIYGNIVNIDDSYLVPSMKRLLPKVLDNITLVYNLENRNMRFTTKKNGLVIIPEDDGQEGWSKLLGVLGHLFAENIIHGNHTAQQQP